MTFSSVLSFFARLSSLSFGRKVAASFGFGLLAALAFPPFNLIPVLWLSFPALVLLLRGGGKASLRAERSNPEQTSSGLPQNSPPLAGGVRGGVGEANNPSPRKTKPLLRKGRFFYPLPQGERMDGETKTYLRNALESLSASLQRFWIASALKGLAMTKEDKRAFVLGWIFALGSLSVSFHWIAGALFVDIKSFWWAVPLAVFGLPAVLGIYYGLAAMVARRWGMSRAADLFFFALCWFGAEMARAHLFTGFPWDILGYVWADCLPVLQSVSVIGIEGLTLLTILLAVLPAAGFMEGTNDTPTFRLIKRGPWFLLFLGVFIFFCVAAWGQHRLSAAVLETVPGVRLRLVQPGTQQAMKWKPERRMLNFNSLLSLTFDVAGEKPITHYIWPETATSFYLAEEPMARSNIAGRMPEGSILLTGSVRRAVDEAANDYRYYNSLIVMDSKGAIVGGYDKHHLVPFGEYMPWRSFIPFRVVTALGTDFSAGEGVRSVRAAGLPPFSALVCYEAIFSGAVAERNDPPRFLLNVTNDAWYEGTIGPAQHFAIAKVRAVEEGLPLVRVANKGVTGVVDPYGRVVAKIGAEEAGHVDSELPKAAPGSTIFAKQGTRMIWFMAACLLFALIVLRCKRK